MKRRLTLFSTAFIMVMLNYLTFAPVKASTSHYVAFLPPAFTSPFHVAIADGAKAEAAKLGWRIEVQAPSSENDSAGQVALVQQVLERGVEAISVNAIDITAIVTGVKAANAKGVPILMHNFITPLPQGTVTSYIGYNQWDGAEKLGIYTCQLLAKKYNTSTEQAHGKVFILLGIDSIFSHRRTQGYLAGLQKCPDVRVVGQQSAEWLREEGETVATAALQTDPDIDVFYGNSDEMAIGAALGAQRMGRTINRDFFAVSIDGNQPTLDLIKEGKYTATLGVDPYRMGETVIDVMNQVLSGQSVPQYLVTPSTVVDATNIDDYVAGKTWTMPVAGSAEEDNNQPSIEPTDSATAAATSSQ